MEVRKRDIIRVWLSEPSENNFFLTFQGKKWHLICCIIPPVQGIIQNPYTPMVILLADYTIKNTFFHLNSPTKWMHFHLWCKLECHIAKPVSNKHKKNEGREYIVQKHHYKIPFLPVNTVSACKRCQIGDRLAVVVEDSHKSLKTLPIHGWIRGRNKQATFTIKSYFAISIIRTFWFNTSTF